MAKDSTNTEDPALYYMSRTESQDSIHDPPEMFNELELKCLKHNQLKALIKKHEINPKTYLNKKDMIELLKEHNVLPADYIEYEKKQRIKRTKSDKPQKEPNTKYEWLTKNRKNPRRVEITDIDNDEVRVFPSIYKTCKYLGTTATKLIQHDGYNFNKKQNDDTVNRYRIKILDQK